MDMLASKIQFAFMTFVVAAGLCAAAPLPILPPPEKFPDGVFHDFGTVKRGTKCEHAFRIVNTSTRPMRITELRRA